MHGANPSTEPAKRESARDLMHRFIETGDPMVVVQFITHSDLYLSDPDAVHVHLSALVEGAGGEQATSILSTVTSHYPLAMVPHIPKLIDRCKSPIMGTVFLHMLTSIAKASPNSIYPFIDSIMSLSNQPGRSLMVVSILASAARATNPDNAAETVLSQLILLLESKREQSVSSAVLMEISNMKDLIEPEDILKHIKFIRSFRQANASPVIALEEFAARLNLR